MLFTSTLTVGQKNPPPPGTVRTGNAPVFPGQRSAAGINLLPLQALLISLSRNCADALGKSVQHFQGEDAWAIGAMPNCSTPADALEAEARALLCNSLLTNDQISDVTITLKVASDLRAVARSARQAAQICWLFRQLPNSNEATALILPVGEAAYQVARLSADAVEKNDPILARDAALLYRKVEAARIQAVKTLDSGIAAHGLSPELLRMTRSAIWFMAIAGECMARIAARVAL